MSTLFGFLNIDKPAGLTSRRVVDAVARLVRPAKAGHAGTLDPLATGVLVVVVGHATRMVPRLHAFAKEYRAVFRLGCRSDTDDVTGNVEPVDLASGPISEAAVELELASFVGTIEQVPPAYSAVHIDGRRAYERARAGEAVTLAPRTVVIHGLEITRFEYPELEVVVECGSGTYIRSLGRDLGARLGCGAVMSDLVRTRIGPYTLEAALPFDELNEASLGQSLLSPLTAIEHLARQVCSDEELELVRNGRPVDCRIEPPPEAGSSVALVTADEELAALAEFDQDESRLAPKQVFVT